MTNFRFRFSIGLTTEFGDTVLVEFYKNGKPVGVDNRILLDELSAAMTEIEALDDLPDGDAVIISGVPTFAHAAISIYLSCYYLIVATHYKTSNKYIVVASDQEETYPIGYRSPEVDHSQVNLFWGGD